MVKENSNKIIYWILTGLVAIVFIGSAVSKFIVSPDSLKMAGDIGLNAQIYTILGVVELISVLLFIVPRTGLLGTLLLAAYMGGAIATHLEHGQSVAAPSIIQAFLWVVAVYRFPELRSRLLNKQIVSK